MNVDDVPLKDKPLFLGTPEYPVRTDRAGFPRRWGVNVFWARGAPWVSVGIHVDWHTPTLDLHIGRGAIQVGRNNWQGRLMVAIHRSDGHTDQCLDR